MLPGARRDRRPTDTPAGRWCTVTRPGGSASTAASTCAALLSIGPDGSFGMDASISYLIQILNGVQYGFLLFLVASGLTLVFGIMGVVNLAHGAFYMVGAYLAFWLSTVTGSFALAILIGVPISVLLGLVVERIGFTHLYHRDHLYQVLFTFGLILVIGELRAILWGNDVHGVAVPPLLSGSVVLTETQSYPIYRLFISVACLAAAVVLAAVIKTTRLGMMIRASATNREMVQVLGLNVDRLFMVVFGLGIGLAAFAGMIAAPVSSVHPGMGDEILIVSFVVVVIGGVGSIMGAFWGAMLIGLADTFGAVLLPGAGGAVVYALMALVLAWRPNGLFAGR
ncbi:High-affinity branched-chain amino acid transport system permease protein LivH [Rhodoplanes serenus]|uniref:High-affinity branched-chain amino acid transport system permease protein LivH n=2 Tax=Nitrobacteraceae TaxID=41294 RepID=A0A3S4B5X9_9BRAD|nr:High-affinity branched-chain amino acid transport system permease protein LivH [Rhodoplanes serenus]